MNNDVSDIVEEKPKDKGVVLSFWNHHERGACLNHRLLY